MVCTFWAEVGVVVLLPELEEPPPPPQPAVKAANTATAARRRTRDIRASVNAIRLPKHPPATRWAGRRGRKKPAYGRSSARPDWAAKRLSPHARRAWAAR